MKIMHKFYKIDMDMQLKHIEENIKLHIQITCLYVEKFELWVWREKKNFKITM